MTRRCSSPRTLPRSPMAAHKIGLACVGVVTLLWSLYPLLFQARGVIVLDDFRTGGLGACGWVAGMPLGGMGWRTGPVQSHLERPSPPNLRTCGLGCGAGITLRRSWMAVSASPTSSTAMSSGGADGLAGRPHAHRPGLLAQQGLLGSAGGGLGGAIASGAGVLTIVGASLLLGALALLLLYTSRWPERE